MESLVDTRTCERCGTVHAPGDPGCSDATIGSTAARSALDAQLAREPDEPQAIDPLLGQIVGEYEVREVLGRGGMGVVYGGVQPLIDKPVAIKVLHSALSHDPSGMKRFVAEARAVNRIRHPNIVDIFAFGTLPDGSQYLVMERLDGRTLSQFLKARRTTSYADARPVLGQVLDALEAAHGRGVVHRDLKPDNIFLCDQPGGGLLVKLMDFGIAKFADDTGTTHMTKTGVPMGTPLYMAPEQCQGRGVDHRSDIYSLGVILFRMFCGSEPFGQGTTMEVMLAHMTLPPPPPRSLATIPEELERVILHCLAKDKADRPESVAALRAELMPLLERLSAEDAAAAPEKLADAPALPPASTGAMQALAGGLAAAPPTKARWPRAAAVVGGLLVVGGVAAVLLWPRPQPVAPPSAPTVAAPKAEQPRPGVLLVSSRPAGARVIVDGADTGRRTPATIDGLDETRPHKVQLQLEGYEPWSAQQDVTVRAGGSASVEADLRQVAPAAPAPGHGQPGADRGRAAGTTGKHPGPTRATKAPAGPEQKVVPKPDTKRGKLFDDI